MTSKISSLDCRSGWNRMIYSMQTPASLIPIMIYVVTSRFIYLYYHKISPLNLPFHSATSPFFFNSHMTILWWNPLFWPFWSGKLMKITSARGRFFFFIWLWMAFRSSELSEPSNRENPLVITEKNDIGTLLGLCMIGFDPHPSPGL